MEERQDFFECPKCDSEDTETYIYEEREHCLNCGHDFKLTKTLYSELKKDKINNEIDSGNMAYKIEDIEGNIFVFVGLGNGFPWYRGRRGSKHIFDLAGYKIIEKYCKM